MDKIYDCYDFIQNCISSDAILRNAKYEPEELEKSEESAESEDITEQKTKFTCTKCDLSFSNKTSYTKHKNSHEDNPYKCDKCFQCFQKKMHLNVHLRSHIKDEDKKFVCKTCNKQFMYEYLLKQHEYKHSDEKPYPCKICNKGKYRVFINKFALKVGSD